MKDLAYQALEVAKLAGASYADIRIIVDSREIISVKNGAPLVNQIEGFGFGVRVIADGSWGFAASPMVDKDNIEKTAALAVKIAKSSAKLKRFDIKLADEPIHKDKWNSAYIIDPFKVPLEKKIGLLMSIDKTLRSDNRIKIARGELSFWRENQFFVSSEDSEIEQTFIRSGGGYAATAVDDKSGEIQTRSYPGVQGDQFLQLGWEVIESYDYEGNAERVREEALSLLSAEKCPKGEMDIIISGEQLALQIHESLGHPTELDRVLGMEANYAGTSFLTTEKLGNFRYGSEIVNIVADGTQPGGIATIGYDDDGVRSGRWFLVKDGIFCGYLTNRELTHVINDNRSRGCNRADGWNSLPMIRMTNISLIPGEWDFDDLIADTDKGILFGSNKSWSIDQKRLNFQFTSEIGWLIEKGKIVNVIKNPTYQSITPKFWASCDAICNENHWTLWGVPNCGKGQPGQIAEMSHGAAPSRFRKVNIGLG